MQNRHKFFPEDGTVQVWMNGQYVDKLMVVAVVPAGREVLVVLSRAPNLKKPEGFVEVLKVPLYHRWNALRALAHAMAKKDWHKNRRYLLDGCPEPGIDPAGGTVRSSDGSASER